MMIIVDRVSWLLQFISVINNFWWMANAPTLRNFIHLFYIFIIIIHRHTWEAKSAATGKIYPPLNLSKISLVNKTPERKENLTADCCISMILDPWSMICSLRLTSPPSVFEHSLPRIGKTRKMLQPMLRMSENLGQINTN